MKKDKKIKKQHFVPQFYLRNFSKNKKSIEVFDKEQLKFYTANIKDIACKNYFYDVKNESFDDENQIVEKMLGKIESECKRSIDSIIQKINDIKINYLNCKKLDYLIKITNKEKTDIATFFVIQWIRTDKKRQELIQITEQLKSFIVQTHKEENIFLNDSKLETDIKMQHVELIFSLIKSLRACFLEQKWVFGINLTNRPFYTSDNPAILDNYFCKNKLYRGNGFESKNVQCYLPLNDKIILNVIENSLYNSHPMLKKKIKDISLYDENNVLYCNSLQITSSLFQIYSPQCDYFDEDLSFCIDAKIEGNKNRTLIQSNIPFTSH